MKERNISVWFRFVFEKVLVLVFEGCVGAFFWQIKSELKKKDEATAKGESVSA